MPVCILISVAARFHQQEHRTNRVNYIKAIEKLELDRTQEQKERSDERNKKNNERTFLRRESGHDDEGTTKRIGKW